MLNLSLELGMFVLEILEIDHGVFEANIHDTLEMLLELVKLLDDIPIDVRAVVDHLLHHSVGFSKLIVVSFELVHLLLELEGFFPQMGSSSGIARVASDVDLGVRHGEPNRSICRASLRRAAPPRSRLP